MIEIVNDPNGMWPDLSNFNNSDFVTYKYYCGRMALFDSRFKPAEENLETAFHKCPVNAIENRKQILKYLVPVKIFCGKFPTKEFFEKYELFEYVDIVQGLITCNY